jgi:predicted phage-related endonuclease
MTERQIENRVRKLKELESQRKVLEEQEKALKAEIKKDMESKGLEEMKTKNFAIRWKEIISNSLDSKALRASFPDICEQFTKQSASKRFTIA